MRSEHGKRAAGVESPFRAFRLEFRKSVLPCAVSIDRHQKGRGIAARQRVQQARQRRNPSAIDRHAENHPVVPGKPMVLPTVCRKSQINLLNRSSAQLFGDHSHTRTGSVRRAEINRIIRHGKISFRFFSSGAIRRTTIARFSGKKRGKSPAEKEKVRDWLFFFPVCGAPLRSASPAARASPGNGGPDA